jgi:hypothetical protein
MLRRRLLALTMVAAFVGVVGGGVRPAHAYVPDGYAHASDVGPGEAR